VPKKSKVYSHHLANEPSELCLHTRTQFLEVIVRLKPQVVADLWETAFPAFKLAVIRRFAKEIFNGIEDVSGYFDEQQKKHLHDPDSTYFHLLQRRLEQATGAPPYGAFAVLSEKPELKDKVNEVIRDYVAAFQEGLAVKLIQSKLTTEFGVDPIRWKFRFYADIAGRNDEQGLAAAIQKWSEKWNLNADWCRDHAVAVLREWLSHPQLSSVGLYTAAQAMQRTGWASASHEMLFASISSRISADAAVYGAQGPKPLKFRWRDQEFEREGFHRLRESQKEYRQRSLAEFELWLSDKRRPGLLEVLHSNDEEADCKIDSLHEILTRFTNALNQHIRATLQATDESAQRLAKGKTKRLLPVHIRWAVEFHVPPRKTLDEIVEFENSAEAVAGVLRDTSPKGLTREEIGLEFSDYDKTTGNDLDRALALLLERGIIYTQQEDPTSRVIAALRAEGRGDCFGPYQSVGDDERASAVIRERIEADYEKTGGVMIVRYFRVADKKIRETPDRSVVSRAAKDILILVGLEKGPGTKRTRDKSKPEFWAEGA
jgi:hypothetical protein